MTFWPAKYKILQLSLWPRFIYVCIKHLMAYKQYSFKGPIETQEWNAFIEY